MFRDKERYGQDPTKVVRSAPSTFNAPLSKSLKWRGPAFVFTCSWSDWFIEEADAWRDDAWDVIRKRPDLTFQILTKRPERILGHLPKDWGGGYKNVWMGISAEDQANADVRIPLLLQVPSHIRFISYEPALGPVDFANFFGQTGKINWLIGGGESGPKARPFDLDWMRAVVQQCKQAGVACFVKQLGAHPISSNEADTPLLAKIKHRAGADPSEWPQDLVVQEFPVDREPVAMPHPPVQLTLG